MKTNEGITNNKELMLEHIMTHYSKDVYLLAYSFVKEKGLAEDVSQEVFIKCYRNLDSFRGDAEIKSWIYRITVNTAKDAVKKKSFKILKFPKVFFENFKKSESAEKTMLKYNHNEQILHIVLDLPIIYREVIILYYFQDLKVNEISDALNVNINSVKTRLSRGRSILKEKMVKKGEIPFWIDN
ncbi:sigma-70 family RNA polymerase sigma factor [Rossellomorea sp. SC111]|uniref:sigma-70 family RNA polymerase sigma factor n=1 Tax=Rossellomorea sp. SC111 TaxID=2968985 RepID=UPI00215AA136|nr:sigma-70 family RNA polymerase sigma factor [Rossellomorea sp. SC111]MCR8849380.1 sigma-70 family RNA polymerase sigma factor [Rossellomorea sp. SC111]